MQHVFFENLKSKNHLGTIIKSEENMLKWQFSAISEILCRWGSLANIVNYLRKQWIWIKSPAFFLDPPSPVHWNRSVSSLTLNHLNFPNDLYMISFLFPLPFNQNLFLITTDAVLLPPYIILAFSLIFFILFKLEKSISFFV